MKRFYCWKLYPDNWLSVFAISKASIPSRSLPFKIQFDYIWVYCCIVWTLPLSPSYFFLSWRTIISLMLASTIVKIDREFCAIFQRRILLWISLLLEVILETWNSPKLQTAKLELGFVLLKLRDRQTNKWCPKLRYSRCIRNKKPSAKLR